MFYISICQRLEMCLLLFEINLYYNTDIIILHIVLLCIVLVTMHVATCLKLHLSYLTVEGQICLNIY